jgi:hypothetical protein
MPWGFAVIKAAIAAKFILIGRALHIGEGDQTKPLIWETLHKSIVFLIFVAVLTVIEEAIVGLIHGRMFLRSIADIGGGTSEQFIATAAIMFLVFLLMFAFLALSEMMEDRALVRTFFVERLEFEGINRRSRESGSGSPGSNVRYGSKADIASRPRHVRYSPQSGHSSARFARPLSATNGH